MHAPDTNGAIRLGLRRDTYILLETLPELVLFTCTSNLKYARVREGPCRVCARRRRSKELFSNFPDALPPCCTLRAACLPHNTLQRQNTQTHVRQEPWDPSAFNFYKADPREFVLSYVPSFKYERETASKAAPGTKGIGIASESGLPIAVGIAAAAQDKVGTGGLRGVGDQVLLEQGLDLSSVECGVASTAFPPQDAVLVNIRPVGPVSLLLTPG